MSLLLEKSGLPISFNDVMDRLSFSDAMAYASFGVRTMDDVRALYENSDGYASDLDIYMFYRDVCYPEHRQLFSQHGLRYDITMILPGTINGEYYKTSGHFHGFVSSSRHSYPEVYEVLYGCCMYILQKSSDIIGTSAEMSIHEVILLRVDAGQAVVIPPDYGHCAINIGKVPLVFSNIAALSCPLSYGPFRERGGASYRVFEASEGPAAKKNHAYGLIPEARWAVAKPAPALGLDFEVPSYQRYVREPGMFAYLTEPQMADEALMDSIMLREGF